VPWAAAATLVSAGIGASSSSKARKAANAQANAANAQAEQAARLGREQFEWYKQEYYRTRPQREQEAARAGQIADAQYAGMLRANQRAEELDTRNKLVYQPLEDGIISDAQNFDTEAKREELAGQAMADTNRAFTSANEQQIRQLNASGINPNSGAAIAAGQNARVSQALALAGGANNARNQARLEGYARKMDASRFGQGALGQQAGMMQLASGMGSAAVGSGMNGLNATYSGANLMGQGFGSAMQGMGMGNQSRQLGGQFQNTANYWQGQQDNAIGSALGSMVDIYRNWGSSSGGGSGGSSPYTFGGSGKVDYSLSSGLGSTPRLGGGKG
jgi:hypothetical protein